MAVSVKQDFSRMWEMGGAACGQAIRLIASTKEAEGACGAAIIESLLMKVCRKGHYMRVLLWFSVFMLVLSFGGGAAVNPG